MENMLQSFLDAGMLNMVEDDEKYKHLQETAQELAAKPPKLKTDVINYTLVALDPEAQPHEPIFDKVEATLKKHWQTFRAKFPDVPRQLLRAIIFETLRIRGEKDVATAAIIWWTGASYFPYADLGREKEICRAFLTEMGGLTEKQAEKEWSSDYSYSPPEFPSFEINFKAKPYGISKEALTKQLAAASGPNDAQGSATGPNPNSYLPNQPTQWVHNFAPRAATGIAEVVNTSLNALSSNMQEWLSQAGANLATHAAEISKAVGDAMGQVAQSAEATERRSQLLWWRQTLYSTTLKQGYREMEPATAALMMGYDLYKQVTNYYPQSVEYLLREAVRSVRTSNADPIPSGLTLVDFCRQLQTSDQVARLKQELKSTITEGQGRVPLLNVVKNAIAGEALEPDELTDRVGVKSDTKVDLEDLAVWMLRDLQAHHLASQK